MYLLNEINNQLMETKSDNVIETYVKTEPKKDHKIIKDKYKVMEVLGEGTYGIVYKGL